MVKRLPTMRETRVWSLGQEEPLVKELATHSSVLAWKIPWTEEPGRLQSMGSQRVGYDWATSPHLTSTTYQPTYLLIYSPAYIHNCWQTHPRRPDDWYFPASRLWTVFSGMCPAGPILPGWSLQLHLQMSLIPTTWILWFWQNNSINVQVRRVDIAALSKGVEMLGVQKDQAKFGIPISSCWAGVCFSDISQRYTQPELIQLCHKEIPHEVWYDKMWKISPKLVIMSSDM